MALKKGICKNYDNCDLADKQEIQEVDSIEFKCQECGKDLHELDEGAGTTTGGGMNKKLIAIIGGAVLVVGLGVGGYFAFSGDKSAAPEAEETEMAEEATETGKQAAQPASTTKAAPAAKQDTPKTSTSSSSSLPYGSYSGPTQGGVPHGAGGTISVTSSYQIDLKDGRGSMLDVHPGDKIANTKFENGRLRSGELQRADGTRKWFNC